MPREIEDAIQTYRGNLSTNSILNTLQMDGEFHSLEEAQQINRELATSLYRDVDFRGKSVDPDASIELSAGNSWYLGSSEQWKFGVHGPRRLQEQLAQPRAHDPLGHRPRRSTSTSSCAPPTRSC